MALCFAGTASALMPVGPGDLSPACQSVLAFQGPQGNQVSVLNAPDPVLCPPFEKRESFMSPPITDSTLLTINVQNGAEFMVSGVKNLFGLNFFKRTNEPSFDIQVCPPAAGSCADPDTAIEYVVGYMWFDNARGYETSASMEFLAPEWPENADNPKYLGLYKGKIPEGLPEGQYFLKFGNSQGGPRVAKINVFKELPETGQGLPEVPVTPEVPQTPIDGILEDNTELQPEAGNPPIVVYGQPVAAAIDGSGAINDVLPIIYTEKRGSKWAVLSQFGRNRDGLFSVRANLSGTSKKMRGACNWDASDMVQCRTWLTQRGKWRLTWSVDGENVYARTVIVR